jgi:cellulase
MVYIAPTASNGEGPVWLKLAEAGYSDNTWAVTTLINNKGKHSITLPDLKAGEYLLRPEIIALHEGMNVGGAQFYMECVQIKVTSSGAVSLPGGVAIPGTYTAEDAGIHFNIYNGFSSYPIPGPKVWNGASGSGSTTPAKTSKAAVPSVAATSKAVVSSIKTSAAAVVTSKAAAVSSAKPTTLVTSIKKVTTTVVAGAATSKAASQTPAPAAGTVQKYGQCGGSGYTGPKTCASGSTCKVSNEWYSQCL